MVRFKISIHAQRGGVRRDLAQQAALHEKPKIVVHGRQRDRWDSPADAFINLFGRVMSVRGNDCLVYDLPLVCGSEAASPGKFPELLVGKLHHACAIGG